MNPFAVSSAFLILIAALFCSEIYVPLINQHLITSHENILKTKAFETLAENRNSQNNIEEKLRALQIKGIKINSIQKQSINDFDSYEIDFTHQGILANRFFNESFKTNSHKKIFIVTDG